MYAQEFSVDEVIQRYGGGDYRGKILGEWDPEGCAACSAKNHPENAYRNGELYAAYTAEALNDTLALAKNSGVNLMGLVTCRLSLKIGRTLKAFGNWRPMESTSQC